MNETEAQELYQRIFSADRIERWKSWEGHRNTKSSLQECGTHPLAQTPSKKHNRWNGGMTHMGGYRFVYVPDHPKANPSGHVREHVLVAEMALGSFLPPGAVTHHVNENKLDNIDNLVLCENRAFHNMLHRRLRALKECGNPDWLRCPICKTWDAPDNLYVRTDHNRFAQARHPACHAADVKKRNAALKSAVA